MIAILADLHLHEFPEFAKIVVHPQSGLPINSRLNDQLQTLYYIVERSKKQGCDRLIINGDLFHRRDSVSVAVLQFAGMWLRWCVNEMKMDVYINIGNHDQADRDGSIHSVYSFDGLCTVIGRPTHAAIGGTTVMFVPFVESLIELKELLSKTTSADLLVAHIGVEGAVVGTVEYRIKTPIKVDDLHPKRFKWVVLGHYHKPQKLAKNVLYEGSPYQINRAEVGETKRFLMYNPKDGSLKSYPTHAKQFLTITAEAVADAVDLKDNYYDVILSDDETVNAIAGDRKISKKLIPQRKAKVSKKRMVLSETMSDNELLLKYLENKKANTKLLNFGASILGKVQATSTPYTNLRFLNAAIYNFMAIKKVKLNLDRPGDVVAIMGNNQDRPGYISNGAGKSTLLPEALFWCLFNTTARKLPANKVVNRFSKRNCKVRFEIALDQDRLVVIRYRKHRKLGGTGLKLYLNKQDITQGTPELTEQKLQQLIGVDYLTFSSVIAFSPDNLKFVGNTDANQKQVLDSILQTRRFTAALDVAKSIQAERKQSILILEDSLESDNALLAAAEETQADYKQANRNFEIREQERVAGIRERYKELKEQRQTNFATLQDQITNTENVQGDLDGLRGLPHDTTIGHTKVRIAGELLAAEQAKAMLLQAQLIVIEEKLAQAVDLAGKPCPTCGTKVSNTGKLIAGYQNDRVRVSNQLESQRIKVTQCQEAKEMAEQFLKDVEAVSEQISHVEEKLEKSQRAENQLKIREARFKESMAKLKEELVKGKPVNDFKKLIAKNQSKIDVLASYILADETKLKRYKSQLTAVEFWVHAFGSAGIRSFLLDQIMPQLTEYANEFSESLTGGGTVIEFQTYNEDTMKDKFKIQAFNQDGSDVYKGNSSGEKRRIDICVMFALFKIAHQRIKVNILLLDEILDTLDAYGLETILDTIHKLAEDLKLAVYVTSHTSLNELIHNSIVLEKHEGQSILVS